MEQSKQIKKYVEKRFENDESYIEAIPVGYPEWWNEFAVLVEKSTTLNELAISLMKFKPYNMIPQFINGVIVFNPLVFDFLVCNTDYLQIFYKGHIEGKQKFKETYFKKYPNEEDARFIMSIYNADIKETILMGHGVFSKSNVSMMGFLNGTLTGYWNYENDYLKTFEKLQETSKTNEETKKKAETLSEHINDEKSKDIANAIKSKYSHFYGKEFNILYEACKKLSIFPKNKKLFHNCCKNDFGNIGNYSNMESRYFARGGLNPINGSYTKTEDEIKRDEIADYLKSIMNPK